MQQKSINPAPIPHHLILHERNVLDLEGVTDVGQFDELSVIAYTTQGALVISGHGLHICRLNLEDGILSIEGEIDSMTYHEMKKKGGFLSRILR